MGECRNYSWRGCLLGALYSVVCLLHGAAFAQNAAPATPGVLTFSPEEQAWLDQHPVIRFSADPSWPPFSIGSKDGIEGVDADFLALVAERVGVKFEYVHAADWQDLMDKLNRMEIDLASGIASIQGRNLRVLYSAPYASFPMAVIMRDDGPFFTSLAQIQKESRVVVGPADYAPTLFIRQNFPEIPLITTTTSLEALRMVAAGKADAMIENLGVASHLIKTSGLGNLKITGLAAERFDLNLAVRADAPELRGIIDKALAAITEEDRLRIFDKWLLVDLSPPATWAHFWKYFLVGLLFAGSIITVILIWNRRLARELARRRKAEDSLRESESTFRNLFETMQDAYFLTRPGGEIQLVNAEAVRMLQLGSRRFIERLNIATFFEQPGERDRVMEQLNLQGTLRDYPLEFARADGSLCGCHCNIQILRDTTGEQIAIEYIARWDDPRPPTADGRPPTAGGS